MLSHTRKNHPTISLGSAMNQFQLLDDSCRRHPGIGIHQRQMDRLRKRQRVLGLPGSPVPGTQTTAITTHRHILQSREQALSTPRETVKLSTEEVAAIRPQDALKGSVSETTALTCPLPCLSSTEGSTGSCQPLTTPQEQRVLDASEIADNSGLTPRIRHKRKRAKSVSAWNFRQELYIRHFVTSDGVSGSDQSIGFESSDDDGNRLGSDGHPARVVKTSRCSVTTRRTCPIEIPSDTPGDETSGSDHTVPSDSETESEANANTSAERWRASMFRSTGPVPGPRSFAYIAPPKRRPDEPRPGHQLVFDGLPVVNRAYIMITPSSMLSKPSGSKLSTLTRQHAHNTSLWGELDSQRTQYHVSSKLGDPEESTVVDGDHLEQGRTELATTINKRTTRRSRVSANEQGNAHKTSALARMLTSSEADEPGYISASSEHADSAADQDDDIVASIEMDNNNPSSGKNNSTPREDELCQLETYLEDSGYLTDVDAVSIQSAFFDDAELEIEDATIQRALARSVFDVLINDHPFLPNDRLLVHKMEKQGRKIDRKIENLRGNEWKLEDLARLKEAMLEVSTTFSQAQASEQVLLTAKSVWWVNDAIGTSNDPLSRSSARPTRCSKLVNALQEFQQFILKLHCDVLYDSMYHGVRTIVANFNCISLDESKVAMRRILWQLLFDAQSELLSIILYPIAKQVVREEVLFTVETDRSNAQFHEHGRQLFIELCEYLAMVLLPELNRTEKKFMQQAQHKCRNMWTGNYESLTMKLMNNHGLVTSKVLALSE